MTTVTLLHCPRPDCEGRLLTDLDGFTCTACARIYHLTRDAPPSKPKRGPEPYRAWDGDAA